MGGTMGRMQKVYRHVWAGVRTSWPLIIWIGVNYGIFKTHYSKYKNAPEHYFLRAIIGRGLCISRATAAMLNLSCCILVLSMCRSLNLFLHYVLSLISRRALLFWIENAKTAHIICAGTVIVESVAHTIAHCINAVNFSIHYDKNHPSLNWAKYAEQPAWEMILTSVVGNTGIIMVCLLSMMSITSIKCIREKHYQLFWIVHHLYLPFLIVLLCHPLSGKLKEQKKNVNINCSGMSNNISLQFRDLWNYQELLQNGTQCETEPTWMWIVPPLFLIVFDRVFWILKRNSKKLSVMQVARLPGSVVHLVLQSPSKNFICRPGQYILLQCPMISSVEWHPFSVVSFCSSDHPSLSVLIRAKGDWTEELLSRVLVPFAQGTYASKLLNKTSCKPIIFLVDGPFRSPLEEVLNSSVAVCIAAGIGITPFIAILNYLLNSTLQNTPRRLHLLWLLQDAEQLLWCAKLLCDLHEKFWQANVPDKFFIQVHITRNYNAVKIQKAINDDCKLLVQRIWKGRPNWHEIFNELLDMYSGQTVNVYASGPKCLISEVGTWCNNMKDKGLSMRFFHEIF
ncbi:Dual oxidase [Gryllus bimaculatus]|nr:Dual oxidase [Gryllus bimaculatus]